MRHQRLAGLVAMMVALGGCEDGLEVPGGEQGPPGEMGPAGEDGAPGSNGIDGEDGLDGLACWDLDSDGVADPSEDQNGDGAYDALDCTPQIQREVVTSNTNTVTAFQQDLFLSCPTGLVPYGGGHRLVAENNSTNVEALVTVSAPTESGWALHARSLTDVAPGYPWRIEGWVICGN